MLFFIFIDIFFIKSLQTVLLFCWNRKIYLTLHIEFSYNIIYCFLNILFTAFLNENWQYNPNALFSSINTYIYIYIYLELSFFDLTQLHHSHTYVVSNIPNLQNIHCIFDSVHLYIHMYFMIMFMTKYTILSQQSNIIWTPMHFCFSTSPNSPISSI